MIGAIAAVLIGAATFGLSVKNRLTVEQMFVALLILETPVIGLIGFYTGSYAVNRLTVSWFLGINLYIALPWAMGQIISALVKNRRVT